MESKVYLLYLIFFLSRKRHILVVLVSSCCSLLLPPDSGIFTETVSMILTNLQPLHFTFNQDYKYLQMFITLLLYKTEQWQTELELMKSWRSAARSLPVTDWLSWHHLPHTEKPLQCRKCSTLLHWTGWDNRKSCNTSQSFRKQRRKGVSKASGHENPAWGSWVMTEKTEITFWFRFNAQLLETLNGGSSRGAKEATNVNSFRFGWRCTTGLKDGLILVEPCLFLFQVIGRNKNL